jgi:hypothetical protein
MEESIQLYTPNHLTHGERAPNRYLIGGSMGHRAHLGDAVKTNPWLYPEMNPDYLVIWPLSA